jgi:hypothetical protein
MGVKSTPDVIISIDLGGSLTKISAITKDGQYCLLALLSEVAVIPADILQDVQKLHWGEASPEARIWVATSLGEGYALGSYAREQFLAHSNLKLSKLDLAVPKILGALWVIQQKLGLNPGYKAFIGCLLPPAECAIADQQDLIERLIPQLKEGFVTPTGVLTVKLVNTPVVKPEGAGVFKAFQYKSSERYFNMNKIGFLGIGFRNSNLLVANKGAIGMSDRHTSPLGFYSFVSSASQEIGSAVDEIQLASIIGQAGLDINRLYLSFVTFGEFNEFASFQPTRN